VELFAFDGAYVGRLRQGDPQTEGHFVSYFDQLLRIKLRARMLAQDTVEELRQETLRRVIAALRSPGGVRQPERFGAFVNSTCNNVLMEFYRSSGRSEQLEEYHLDKTDRVLDVESSVATQEMCQHIRRIGPAPGGTRQHTVEVKVRVESEIPVSVEVMVAGWLAIPFGGPVVGLLPECLEPFLGVVLEPGGLPQLPVLGRRLGLLHGHGGLRGGFGDRERHDPFPCRHSSGGRVLVGDEPVLPVVLGGDALHGGDEPVCADGLDRLHGGETTDVGHGELSPTQDAHV